MTTRIDGKAFAAQVRERVAAEVSVLQDRHGVTPGLAVVLVGEDGNEAAFDAQGDGPIAAACHALERLTGVEFTLRNFELHSASVGEDAQGAVTVTVEHDGDSYRGHGTSVDIVEAGTRACLEVINRILRRRARPGGRRDPSADASRATI